MIDPFLDFEATREYFGIGNCNYSIGKAKLSSGETVVYMNQQRESDREIDTPTGPRKICVRNLVICGYRENPKFLGFLRTKKIRIIPQEERDSVKSEIINIIRNRQGDMKINDIIFWD